MNLAAFALKKRTLMVVLTIMLIGGGIVSYEKIGRLEDPTFTIKTALVVTQYPGASPLEVEQEVTDVIEEAIQSMGQVKKIYSTSQESVSFVYVDMKDTFNHTQLPQIWDELRRKISDVQSSLPPGAIPSIVNDDFGDVFGLFFAITGENHSYAELKDYADSLKKDLLLCSDVAKINLWGTHQEVIYIEFDRSKIAELGINPELIYSTLQGQNLVQKSGQVNVGGEYMRITPTGEFCSPESIGQLLIGGADGLVKLSDIATITRGYQDPPRNLMRVNGTEAIGLGISTVDGGNVVRMGDAVKAKLAELETAKPEGINIKPIYFQSEMVVESVDAFVLNLIEAVVIVVVLLMLFMGWQSGLLIGVVLLLTILCTFIGMYIMNIDLQKISLGALILALGMLVDNAIVVADGILIRVEKGEKREEAAIEVVKDTGMPLMGATIVAILAFTAVGFAQGNVGEFCRSLFDVMAMSLSISWILAVTITPLLCVWFLKIPDVEEGFDPYKRPMFRVYRGILHGAIKFNYLTVLATIIALVGGVAVMKTVPKSFFPGSTKPYFYVNYWCPQGTYIDKTSEDLKAIEKYVAGIDGVKNVSTFVGEGTLRFILSYNYESSNSSYGQILVELDDYRKAKEIGTQVKQFLFDNYPDSEPFIDYIGSGPAITYKVEARLRGPDIDILEELSEKIQAVMLASPNAKNVRTDWRQKVRVVRPQFSESQAHRIGVSRTELANALQWNFNGTTIGVYREDDELLPIISRPPQEQRLSVENMDKVQVWSKQVADFVPIRQIVTDIIPKWEAPLIQRYNRQRSILVRCNPIDGNADALQKEISEKVEDIALPMGYSLEWGGELEDSNEAQAPLKAIFPICIIGMFVIVVWLFNSVRRPLIIFMTVPLAIIGISLGLKITHIPFGFMAILGFLGLSGMLIKNAIVLIDQIELDLKAGKHPYEAVLDSSVSRMRPVIMAAGTTILGMAPLIKDPLYQGMAVTIMSGLFIGTFLTLILVPVLYSIFYKIKHEDHLV